MFNYPNHPLFRITPLLDRGFNTVLHDEYTSRLVGRIRAGRYTPELFDCNSLYLDYGERLAAVRAPRAAFKSRYTMTMQEIRDYQNTPEAKAERAAQLAQRAERKARIETAETALAARRREQAEERQRVGREIEERLQKRQAEKEQRDRDWLFEEERARERHKRIAEEQAKPDPNEQLLAIFRRWLAPKDQPSPVNST